MRGMERIRSLDDSEQRLIQDAYASCRPHMPPRMPTIHWLNLYLNRAFTVDHALRAPLHEWITGTLAREYAGWAAVHILSYGFIVNPSGNPQGQPFHFDYSRTSSNLFVPLTRVSLANAIQFIREPLAHGPRFANDSFGTLEDILEAEGREAIEVAQLPCRAFSLVKLLPDTPHRGIPNTDDYDRTMLWITVDDHAYDIPETKYFQLGHQYASI